MADKNGKATKDVTVEGKDNTFEQPQPGRKLLPNPNLPYGDKDLSVPPMDIVPTGMDGVPSDAIVKGYACVANPTRAELPAMKEPTYSPWKPKGRK